MYSLSVSTFHMSVHVSAGIPFICLSSTSLPYTFLPTVCLSICLCSFLLSNVSLSSICLPSFQLSSFCLSLFFTPKWLSVYVTVYFQGYTNPSSFAENQVSKKAQKNNHQCLLFALFESKRQLTKLFKSKMEGFEASLVRGFLPQYLFIEKYF